MKQGLSYSVASEVFTKFPSYVRGVVLAHDVTNGATPPEVIYLLREAEETLRQQLTLDGLTEHPRMASWREAFRAFGAKPSEFRPSIEAMARRVLRRQELPAINTLVDLGNIISLRCLVPSGGHAMDHLTQNIALRPATGKETFTPLGEEQVENPLPGEIIFAEGNSVLTRRWVWRQSNHTLTLPENRHIEFNVDGLPPVPLAEVEEICREICALVERFCGGRPRYEILSPGHPSMSLDA